MSSLDAEFNRRLSKRLEDVHGKKLGQLAAGALDYESYKRESGYLQALSHVKEWCAEIENDISEGK